MCGKSCCYVNLIDRSSMPPLMPPSPLPLMYKVVLTTCVIIATCAVTGTIEDILSRYFFLICFFIFFNIKHVGVSSIIGFNNKKKKKNTRAYRADFSRILRDDSQVIAVMTVVNGGGVEVDGDLDNRACITDRQEARKERKNLKPLKKIMVNN